MSIYIQFLHMGRSSLAIFMVFMLFSASFMSFSHARKLLIKEEKENKAPSPEDRLYRTALPKGTVTPSAPSKKNHGAIADGKLIARHLAALDRILCRISVPSPGVGH
ncbi:unnamed protein product [Camellia sinensis]